MMVREKIKMGGRFNPERYGMIYCPICKGSGRLCNGIKGGVVCQMCGGFGLVEKEEEIKSSFDVATQHVNYKKT